jgi:microsomal dipeptidase-like Zn-dependent dipeptidase
MHISFKSARGASQNVGRRVPDRGRQLRGVVAITFAATLVGLRVTTVRGETPVRLESCAEVAAQWNAFRTYGGAEPNTSQCWDFENAFEIGMGDPYFGPWSRSGNSFNTQPTYGDNVQAWRVLQEASNHVQRDQLNGIGGDYWQVPYPIGHQGQYWVGTYESRPYEINAWAGTQGDGPTGTAISPEFVINRNYIAFLVGGGCNGSSVYVQLQIKDASGAWVQATHAHITLTGNGSPYFYRTTGECSERLLRRYWTTDSYSGLFGQRARIVINDSATGSWGHINVDHIVHTSAVGLPRDFAGENQPVWGLADTHAHPLNELGFRSEGPVGSALPSATDGYIFHGTMWNALNSSPVANLPSCDSAGHRTDHVAGPRVIASLEGASFGRSPGFGTYPSIDISYHNGQGMGGPSGKDLVGYPYWFTRAHQQMYIGWVRRAYEGGLRLMVAAAGNAETLGSFMRERHEFAYRSDYGVMRKFATRMKEIAADSENGGWLEVAYSPEDARRIVRENKLAIVLGLELDDIGDECAGRLTETGAYTSRDENETTTTSGWGSNPWNQIKDRAEAQSCSTDSEWTRRISDLYSLGYRLITPVHLSNNGLGGAAVYSDLFNVGNYFNTGWFYMVQGSSDVQFELSDPTSIPAWMEAPGFYGPTTMPPPAFSYPNVTGGGHINMQPLNARGLTVLNAMKDRGMLIDIAHMGQHGRQKVLGLGNYATQSIVNPDCDMNDTLCREGNSYPVMASHAGLGQLSLRASENDLTLPMIERIRDIGGTVAIGTSNADVKATNAATGGTWSSFSIFAQKAGNTCAGSSRSFAQAYVYGLRVMNGRGLTLGTDINGLESQVNPRFGSLGCYARGNIPRAYYVGHHGGFLIDTVAAVPINFDLAKISLDAAGNRGTAGGQRDEEYLASAGGLNYAHYAGNPPSRNRNIPATYQFQRMSDPPNYVDNLRNFRFGNIVWGGSWVNEYAGPTSDFSMRTLSALPPLNASVTGNRTFDFNYDGLAHYGMLPDLLQDTRAVGMTREQLGPLFQSADAVIQTWEKACAWARRPGNVSDPTVSDLGCR